MYEEGWHASAWVRRKGSTTINNRLIAVDCI